MAWVNACPSGMDWSSRLSGLEQCGLVAQGLGFFAFAGSLQDDGVEEIGVAELDAQVAGTVGVLDVLGLVGEQRGEDFFGLGAVRG